MKILKFSGEYCGSCKILTTQLSGYKDHKIESYDMVEDIEKFQGYAVRKIPTLMVVNSEGVELDRKIGSCTLAEFEDWVKQIIEKNNEKLDL